MFRVCVCRPLVVRLTDSSATLDVIANQVTVSKVSSQLATSILFLFAIHTVVANNIMDTDTIEEVFLSNGWSQNVFIIQRFHCNVSLSVAADGRFGSCRTV